MHRRGQRLRLFRIFTLAKDQARAGCGCRVTDMVLNYETFWIYELKMSEQIDEKKKKKKDMPNRLARMKSPCVAAPACTSRLLQTLKVLTTSKLASVITCDVELDKSHRDPPVYHHGNRS
jgi:hypothetical protein